MRSQRIGESASFMDGLGEDRIHLQDFSGNTRWPSVGCGPMGGRC